MDAWDLVMRALSHYWRVTRQDNIVAQALLEKAIAIDPNYGQALGVLAASHTFSAHMGWADMATVAPIAERAALVAILADSEDPWAHHALGCVYLFARRYDDSLAEFELALRLNPNFSLAQGYYGLALSYCGRWEEGDLAARRALRLSPIRFPRFIAASPPTPSSSGATTTRRCVFRARASDNAAISSAPTGC
jgi:tetratricopeptide (TPR) repeat protein